MKTLSLARDLRRRKARQRSGRFVAEGIRAVEELLRSPLSVRGALVAPSLAQAPRGAELHRALMARGIEITEVDERDFASAAETESPQGVLAIADVPERTLDHVEVAGAVRLLVLDGVQDPGNVGTMIRTAAALGASATVALPGTVDLWNAKVVRSAMGAQFSHHALAATWESLDAFRARHAVSLWAADAAGSPLAEVGVPGALRARLALVVGNEGAGLTAEARQRADRLVAIPVRGVDSLNVAVAAGIILYALQP